MTKRKMNVKTLELRQLMGQHGLSCRDVGAIVGRSRQAVKRWMGEFTIIDSSMLELLKLKLSARPQRKPQ